MADAQGNDGGSVCVDIGSQTSITLSSQITYSGTGLLTIVGNGATLVGGAHQSSGGIMQLSGVVSPTFFSETTLTVVVSDLSFTGGVAHDGGALWLEAVNATLNHVVMSANTADTRSVGGAIAAYNGSAIGAISLVINDSQFVNNVDDCSGCGSDGGGAVMATLVGVVVNRSTFAGNSSSGPGGAINAPDAAVSVLNSTFNANTSVLGGAINAGTAHCLPMC
jgi:predicted outer membrane repeat protein